MPQHLYGAIGVKCSSLMISSTCSIRWRLSPRPDPTFSFAAERSDGQGWPKAIAKRLALDGREHSGRLVRSGEAGLWCWDSLSRYVSVGNGRRYRGELAIRRNFAPQTCIRSIREDRHHDAVMRIGGEAPRRWAHSKPRLKDHSPISGCRHLGPSSAARHQQEGDLQELSSACPQTVCQAAGRRSKPAGASPVVTSRQSAMRSLRASATIMVFRVPPRASTVRLSYHSANALSF